MVWRRRREGSFLFVKFADSQPNRRFSPTFQEKCCRFPAIAWPTPLAPVTNLSSTVIRILGCNPGPMTLQGTNTYIVGSGSKRILIDTGVENGGYIQLLTGVLKKENISLERIVLTHWHHDHVGRLDGSLAKIGKNSNEVWKYPRLCVQEAETKEKINFLTEGQEISTQGATLKVVHTPGHTSDHISLLLKEENALFSGDCILGEGMHFYESLDEYTKSLRKLSILNPSKIYPGHGPIVENGKGKIDEYIKHTQMRESKMLDFLKERNESLRSEYIANGLFPGIPQLIQLPALVVVNLHLEKLLNEGKVEKENETWKFN